MIIADLIKKYYLNYDTITVLTTTEKSKRLKKLCDACGYDIPISIKSLTVKYWYLSIEEDFQAMIVIV